MNNLKVCHQDLNPDDELICTCASCSLSSSGTSIVICTEPPLITRYQV
ncbi:hypothetical protein IQ243_17625 [Nostocales cyanobacterium LEGE 11386]|nr:hypothetical protein [Nostocales cyanobacterium LEGE 11386]